MSGYKCMKCGRLFTTPASFCRECGSRVEQYYEPLIGAAPSAKPRISARKALTWSFVGFLAFFLLGQYIDARIGIGAWAKTESQKAEELRKSLDIHASSRSEHLEAAKQLLARMDANDYEKVDALAQLITAHASEAEKEPRLKAKTIAIMKQMSVKAVEAAQLRAWNDPWAEITATSVAKQYIEDRLKAPATADWVTTNSRRWRDHPGYFLVDFTVDAQNSFGAKLRNMYECTVSCLSAKACEVSNIYTVR